MQDFAEKTLVPKLDSYSNRTGPVMAWCCSWRVKAVLFRNSNGLVLVRASNGAMQFKTSDCPVVFKTSNGPVLFTTSSEAMLFRTSNGLSVCLSVCPPVSPSVHSAVCLTINLTFIPSIQLSGLHQGLFLTGTGDCSCLVNFCTRRNILLIWTNHIHIVTDFICSVHKSAPILKSETWNLLTLTVISNNALK